MEQPSENPPSDHPIATQEALELQGAGTDWFLQHLVNIVNTTTLTFGLTLQVGGSVVSGQLVSGRAYFDDFAEKFAGAYPGDNEGVEAAFKALGDRYDQPAEDQLAPEYLHLKNFKVFAPGNGNPTYTDGGLFWRGKISSVDGFVLGELQTRSS